MEFVKWQELKHDHPSNTQDICRHFGFYAYCDNVFNTPKGTISLKECFHKHFEKRWSKSVSRNVSRNVSSYTVLEY